MELNPIRQLGDTEANIERSDDYHKKNSSKSVRQSLRRLSQSAAEAKSEPNTLCWKNLSIGVIPKKGLKDKTIIKNVSGEISSGFWAIMGGSGSGKSTLLNCLSCRIQPDRFKFEGVYLYNGMRYDTKAVRSFAGYVMQDDLLHAEFTVDETVMFNAMLRLPEETTLEDRISQKDYVLELMGISHVKEVIIGDSRSCCTYTYFPLV
jgi:ABC-type cobalamin/Fe3+-siderophores transport system ATPase subunit